MTFNHFYWKIAKIGWRYEWGYYDRFKRSGIIDVKRGVRMLTIVFHKLDIRVLNGWIDENVKTFQKTFKVVKKVTEIMDKQGSCFV